MLKFYLTQPFYLAHSFFKLGTAILLTPPTPWLHQHLPPSVCHIMRTQESSQHPLQAMPSPRSPTTPHPIGTSKRKECLKLRMLPWDVTKGQIPKSIRAGLHVPKVVDEHLRLLHTAPIWQVVPPKLCRCVEDVSTHKVIT